MAEWYSSITQILIVEDDPECDSPLPHMILPDALSSECEDLRSGLEQLNEDEWQPIRQSLEDGKLRDQFEDFLYDNNDTSLDIINDWYIKHGKELIEQAFKQHRYGGEYAFLNELNRRGIQIEARIGSYEDALAAMRKGSIKTHGDGVKLWLLDRTLGKQQCDHQILQLLDLISAQDDASIGIIYSAELADLTTRDQVEEHLKHLIGETIPEEVRNGIEAIFDSTEAQQELVFDSKKFKETILKSIDQAYELKTDLHNIFWTLKKGDKFEEQIKRAVYGFSIYRLITMLSTVRKEGLQSALKSMTRLTLSEIDHLNKASVKEGTNISETLARLNEVQADSYAQDNLSTGDIREPYLKLIQGIEQWGDDAGSELSENEKFLKAISHEVYDYYVNPFYRPIMTGDIFQITSVDDDDDLYLLLTPECDCVVRDNRTGVNRRASSATLVKLDPFEAGKLPGSVEQLVAKIEKNVTNPDKVTTTVEKLRRELKKVAARPGQFDQSVALGPFRRGGAGYTSLRVRLKQVKFLDFAALDLCATNDQGRSTMDYPAPSIESLVGVRLQAKFYREHLNNIIPKLRELAALQQAGKYHGSNKIKVENDVADFGIKRVARLKMPHQSYVQAFFGLSQSNVGLPMDYSQE